MFTARLIVSPSLVACTWMKYKHISSQKIAKTYCATTIGQDDAIDFDIRRANPLRRVASERDCFHQVVIKTYERQR
jgi:hypothetical protein